MTELTPKQERMLSELRAESAKRPAHVHNIRLCAGGTLSECTTCYTLFDVTKTEKP